MGLFSKARDMYSLQKQAKTLKKELKNIHIEAEVDGVTVLVNGEQEVLSVKIAETQWAQWKDDQFGHKRAEEAVMKAFTKGLKKAQEIGASKMKGLWGEMGG